MAAKDIYHNTVKIALIKSGWKVTHDPLVLKWGSKDLYIDLGAERLLAAEKSGKDNSNRLSKTRDTSIY